MLGRPSAQDIESLTNSYSQLRLGLQKFMETASTLETLTDANKGVSVRPACRGAERRGGRHNGLVAVPRSMRLPGFIVGPRGGVCPRQAYLCAPVELGTAAFPDRVARTLAAALSPHSTLRPCAEGGGGGTARDPDVRARRAGRREQGARGRRDGLLHREDGARSARLLQAQRGVLERELVQPVQDNHSQAQKLAGCAHARSHRPLSPCGTTLVAEKKKWRIWQAGSDAYGHTGHAPCAARVLFCEAVLVEIMQAKMYEIQKQSQANRDKMQAGAVVSG